MVIPSCWNNIWQSESKPGSCELIWKEMKANCRILGLAYSCLSGLLNIWTCGTMLSITTQNKCLPLQCHHWTLGRIISVFRFPCCLAIFIKNHDLWNDVALEQSGLLHFHVEKKHLLRNFNPAEVCEGALWRGHPQEVDVDPQRQRMEADRRVRSRADAHIKEESFLPWLKKRITWEIDV